jgi:creatinine amidohydrolase
MKHEWALMTWRELRDRARERPAVALVPLACVEAQGPHTPLGYEFLMADALSREVARRTGAVALPALPFGYSYDFVNIPGTVFVRPETLMMLYEDISRSVLRAGFSHILFVGYHIPNQPLIERVARKIRDETGVLCAWVNPGALAATYLKDLFADPVRARGHGAEPGLSLMRHLVPHAVSVEGGRHTPQATEFGGWQMVGGIPALDGVPVSMPINWDDLYPDTGGFGDPTLGSAEIGKKIFDRLADDLAKVVTKFRAMEARMPARKT